MDFRIFENTSHNDVEIKKTHTIEEIICFSKFTGMLISNWFYRKDGNQLYDNINESRHYVQFEGDDLWDLIRVLELVLDETDYQKRDLLAFNYFPVLSPIPFIMNSVEMWTEEYYNALRELYNGLKQIYPVNSVENRERQFYYNLQW